MKKIATALLFCCLISTGCVKLISRPILLDPETLAPADVIVILGYGPPVDEQDRPKPEIERRVQKGVELYQAGLAPYIITTGGNTYKQYYESEIMRDLLVESGVPRERVIQEREAMDTIGNARGSVAIMDEQGWKSCIVVSSPYHLKRARKLFNAGGINVQTAASEIPDSAGYKIGFAMYEYWVAASYLLIDEQQLVKSQKGRKRNKNIQKAVRGRTRAVEP